MAEFSVVMEKLQSFETADDLAEFFRGYGIKARFGSRVCAISEFVRIETGMVEVKTSHVSVNTEDEFTEYRAVHTKAMAEFIHKYDSCDYPDLVVEDVYATQKCFKTMK